MATATYNTKEQYIKKKIVYLRLFSATVSLCKCAYMDDPAVALFNKYVMSDV